MLLILHRHKQYYMHFLVSVYILNWLHLPLHSQPRMEDPVSQVTPSKVLHLRNLPSDVTDKEIIMLGLPFSQVTNVLLLRHKNQAFLEMADVGAATTMVGYYATMPAQIRWDAQYSQVVQYFTCW